MIIQHTLQQLEHEAANLQLIEEEISQLTPKTLELLQMNAQICNINYSFPQFIYP